MFNLFLLLALANLPADKEESIGHMLPYDNEKLSATINLEKDCKYIHIDEWQGKVTPKQINKMKVVCNLVTDNFYTYVANTERAKLKDFTPKKVYPTYGISVLSFNSSFRSLNDTDYRFYYRPGFCRYDNEQQKCRGEDKPLPLYGYVSYEKNWLFINNIFDGDFVYYYAHELFHVFSNLSGFQDIEATLIQDEIYAEEFGFLIEKLFNDK